MDGHPEWFNACDRVAIDLTTHGAGGISQKDIDLAKRLDRQPELQSRHPDQDRRASPITGPPSGQY
jgi:pterin-4a-carbinolamine dehydratase